MSTNLAERPGARLAPFAISLRRDFHMHPERGLLEHRTKEVIERHLTALDVPFRTVGGTGVLGQFGDGRGPVLLLRADMDALPVEEETGLPFASRHAGFMHACGHDAHMAILLAATRHFAETGIPAGTVKILFQPGEEGWNGAAKVIADGALDDPKVDGSFGLHVWREVPVGQIAVIDGPCMAAVDTFEIVVRGRGGHAAYPHLSTDPVTIAAHITTALQTIVAREVDPLDAAVVTVASVQAGTAFNVIPPLAKMRGTCRTFSPAVRTLVHRRVEEIATGVARAMGAEAEVEYEEFLPATVNDLAAAALAREAAAAIVGPENVVPARPSMGGEDMSLILERAPGCFAFVGLRNEARGIVHPHHHPRFDLDEDCVAIGTDLVVEYVRRWFESR